MDFAAEAISKAEAVGATVTAFVTNPATALAVSKVKSATGSNAPLLGQDATAATSRQILGAPAVGEPIGGHSHALALDLSRVWLVLATTRRSKQTVNPLEGRRNNETRPGG